MTAPDVGEVAAMLIRDLHLEYLVNGNRDSHVRHYWREHVDKLAAEVIGIARYLAGDDLAAEHELQELLLREKCRTPLSTAARLVDGPLAPYFRTVA